MTRPIEELAKDSTFAAYPSEQKRTILSELYPNFKNMFPAEQDKYIKLIEESHGGTIRKSPPEWLGPAQTTSEFGGMAAGGMVAGPVGAGLGYAAGRNISNRLGEQFGGYQTQSPLESVKQAAIDFPVGSALEAQGQIISKIFPKLISKIFPKLLPYYGKGNSPESRDIAALGGRENVYMTPPDITGSAGISRLWAGLNMLPSSASIMQKDVAKSIKSYFEYSRRITKQFTKGAEKSKFLTGETAKEGAVITKSNAENTMFQLYDAVRTDAQNTPVLFNQVGPKIKSIEASADYRLLPAELKSEINNIIETIPSHPKRLRGL